MNALLPWVPAVTSLILVGIAWGRIGPTLTALSAQIQAVAEQVRSIDTALSALREAHARSEERHGALAGRVARLEEVDGRHDQEIRDARHAARDAQQTAETATGRLASLEERLSALEGRARTRR